MNLGSEIKSLVIVPCLLLILVWTDWQESSKWRVSGEKAKKGFYGMYWVEYCEYQYITSWDTSDFAQMTQRSTQRIVLGERISETQDNAIE